jgi:Holliday junction resolvase
LAIKSGSFFAAIRVSGSGKAVSKRLFYSILAGGGHLFLQVAIKNQLFNIILDRKIPPMIILA